MDAQARAGLAQAGTGAATLAALYHPPSAALSPLHLAASSAFFRPAPVPCVAGAASTAHLRPTAAPCSTGGGNAVSAACGSMPGVGEDRAMPLAGMFGLPMRGWAPTWVTSREDPGEGSSGGPSPKEAARGNGGSARAGAGAASSPLAPASALQAARALLSSRDSRRVSLALAFWEVRCGAPNVTYGVACWRTACRQVCGWLVHQPAERSVLLVSGTRECWVPGMGGLWPCPSPPAALQRPTPCGVPQLNIF